LARTVNGKNYTWQMSDSPIGSGDAGEVYSVASVEQPNLQGVMKKPAKVATGGTILRQAGQIAREARALMRLDGIPRGKAHPPRLLDTAPEFTEGTANYFIVSETAAGVDLAAMLAESRQTNKAFPRRVIITVLDALFDLFSRAHKSGILWNDVKLEHIYWHNPTSQIAVIDWGNAQFLSQDGDSSHHSLPRWEDYRQMVETLGGFIKRSAPELYADLGWDEFEGQDMDALQISVLARRISYQQQVMSLKVMEYQSLIRVTLQEGPSLDGLQRIRQHQAVLEQIGAPWEQAGVLDYGKSLIQHAADSDDVQTVVKSTALIWEMFDETLDVSWYLIREYFRYPEILSHETLKFLVKHTLNEHWLIALWNLVAIARDVDQAAWWDRLIPVLRQKALGLVTPPPYQSCQKLLSWSKTQSADKSHLVLTLSAILANWRKKGTTQNESPFDYALLDILQAESDLPGHIQREIKESFAAGKRAIRELLQNWVNADWEALPQTFQQILGWDPDRWGILHLSALVDDFQDWLEKLFDGPDSGMKIADFLEVILNERPPIERMLGAPPWFKALINMLVSIEQGAPIADYASRVERWCPWLMQYPDITTADRLPVVGDADSVHNTLSHFVQHLKNWGDIESGLETVKVQAPQHYPLCKKLTEGFRNTLAFNLDPQLLQSIRKKDLHPALSECRLALQVLFNWRNSIDMADYDGALKELETGKLQDWRILTHIQEESTNWLENVMPLLQSIQTQSAPLEDRDRKKFHALYQIALSCYELRQTWPKIYTAGLHRQLLTTLEETADKARKDFLEWRQALEHSSNQAERLLYHSSQNLVQEIAQQLLELTTHFRKSRISFTILDQENQSTLRGHTRTGENILEHLRAIEEILIKESDKMRFPDYQESFKRVIEAENARMRQQEVLSLSEDHPLYAWLVQSVFAD